MKSLPAISGFFLSGVTLLFGMSSAQAQMARLTPEQLPPVHVVSQSREQLLQLGCQPQTVTGEAQPLLVSPEAPYPVVPAQSQAAEVYFCSKEAVSQLQVQGKVLGDFNWQDLVKSVVLGPLISKDKLLGAIDAAVAFVFEVLANLANEVLHLAASWLVPLLTAGSFLTNPLVTKGWPFVLGLANLGFVLGLLFIAITTILRISGFDARRLLVRLLIAALLINFSLIIAGVILDLSRLVTAAIYTSMVGKSITNLPIDILQSSHLVNRVFQIASNGSLVSTNQASKPVSTAVSMSLAFVMIGLLAVAFVALTVGLLVRYFMLILLLIASPLAYLFLALPGTNDLAKKWWDKFIRYTVYGPVVVFILALVVQLNRDPGILRAIESQFGELFGSTILLVLTAVFLFGAAMSGKYVGAAAAGAAAGWVAGQTFGRAGQGVKTAALWTGRTAARETGRGLAKVPGISQAVSTGRGIRGFFQGREKAYQTRAEEQRAAGAERGEKGMTAYGRAYREQQAASVKATKEEAAKPSVEAGKQAAIRRYGTPKEQAGLLRQEQWIQEAQQAAQRVQSGATNAQNLHQDPGLAADRLESLEVGKVVAQQPATIDVVIDRARAFGDNNDQLDAIANNPEIAKAMSATQIRAFKDEIQLRLSQPQVSQTEKDIAIALQRDLNNTLREINRSKTT